MASGGRRLYTKNIYFAGGNFYELQELFSRVRGVVATKAGYINSCTANPQHKDVLAGGTGAAIGIKISYNPKRIDLSTLLDILCTVIDPYTPNKQKKYAGNMYRNGVYYDEQEDEAIVQFYMHFIKSKRQKSSSMMSDTGMLGRKCYMEALPLKNFYPAEEVHQYYLRKNPATETVINFMRLRELEIITAS